MPNKLIYDESTGIHKVRASGIITVDDIRETIEQLEQRSQSDKLINVLVDTLCQTSVLSVHDVNKVAKALSGKNKARYAILSSPNHINLIEQEAMEKVGTQIGKSIRVFTDREKAVAWLLDSK